MFCGKAAGELLPPYVVYKANCLWTTWTENGPPHVRYNWSKSSWFDNLCFEDWFFSTLLPRLKKGYGKQVLIGDNLSSHLTLAVLVACKENRISFLSLPPNSTHLTKPLDVAYFRPMKVAWRIILTHRKEGKGKKLPSIPKHEFPRLLSSDDKIKGKFSRQFESRVLKYRSVNFTKFQPHFSNFHSAAYPPSHCNILQPSVRMTDTLAIYSQFQPSLDHKIH